MTVYITERGRPRLDLGFFVPVEERDALRLELAHAEALLVEERRERDRIVVEMARVRVQGWRDREDRRAVEIVCENFKRERDRLIVERDHSSALLADLRRSIALLVVGR